MNRKTHSNEPYIKDFAFYKTRFANKHKEIKHKLRDYALIVERFQDQSNKAYGDMESGGTYGNIQEVIANVNKTSEDIQMEIDEVYYFNYKGINFQLEEIEKEMSKLSNISQSEKTISYKLKNSLKDLQIEHSQLKIKHHQSTFHAKREGDGKTTNRMKNILKESDRLDSTIALADEIINMGNQSSSNMAAKMKSFVKQAKTQRGYRTQLCPVWTN
ncbi:UNKNOWN [Stylonychia lemnae]|uniref:Uncharacterized protein n=1 Tax=Stylonychia lemnae TaxID=5949 RepID=A0A078ATN9_STYLE|nr:UNKNOWN [Stylonychia lemnae]|eukprot:CDW84213.1 UNKNOWN [Stylonychia lemnae]